MSVYNYSTGNGKKTSFNLYLSNTNVNSFTGENPWNETYIVNLRGVIDTGDFLKSYKVYICYNMYPGLNIGQTFYLRFTLGNSLCNTTDSLGRTANDILIFEERPSLVNRRSQCRFKDNAPLIIKSLNNIDFVNIRLLTLNDTQQTGGVRARQIMLRFEEYD